MADDPSAGILDALGEAYLVVDASGTVLVASPAFTRWPRHPLSRLPALVSRVSEGGSLRFVERLAGRWAEVSVQALPRQDFLVLVRDVEERVRQEEEVKRLRLRVLTIQEDERRAISQNLHDELGQGMTALALRVASIARDVDDPSLAAALGDVRGQVELITKRMRQLFYRIRPPGLHDESLAVALADYCSSVAHSSGLDVVFDAAPELPALDGAEATALYRLLQEALTNVIKHARAESVWVSLAVDGDSISLGVEDDGAGFDTAIRPSGIGLAGLRERFAMLDGELVVDSRVGSGTRVSGAVPVRDPRERG